MKFLKKPKNKPLWLVILLDVLAAGVVLLTFAFFHHVLPAIITQQQIQQSDFSPGPRPVQPVVMESQPAADDPTGESQIQDLRTPWQKKFADHFTDEVVVTDNSYTSPEVSITIKTETVKYGNRETVYYVADVYVASLSNFFTHTAHGQMRYFDTQDATEMANDANAILAISGDFLTYQKNGFLMRNGQVYASDRNNTACVLYADGSMETFDKGEYNIEDVLAKDPVQVWSFGPALLDANGKVKDKYDVSTAVSYPNPRAAIGCYEPGHYCLVVVDGRQDHSYGLTIPQLAKAFEDLGCTTAYNLDGGGSAVMIFGGKVYSHQSNGGRDLGDILVITEAGYTAGTGEG